MTLRKAFVAVPAGAVIAAAAIAPVATSAHAVHKLRKHHRHHHLHARVGAALQTGGNVNCNGIAPAVVPYDLTVPSGKTCTINGSRVGHDVNVQSGATLIDKAGSIGHDLNGNYAKAIGITGAGSTMGKVGDNINIYGTSGATSTGTNYICATSVGGNASVSSSTSKAGPWIIGDMDEACTGGGNQVGGNLTAQNNQDRVDISDNQPNGLYGVGGIGGNLTVTGNLVTATPPAPVVESNVVGGNATCQSGTKNDGDGSANVVRGANNGCH